ncbi:MAG TPA: hypothetical protein DCS09_03940 [Porphyromonadaceae bacterium]|nr:hypothetical protein [Porphyromonadaceae bacterium]
MLDQKHQNFNYITLHLFLIFAGINQITMAGKKLSQTQIASILILWVVLVVYILLYADLTAFTLLSILMSGAFVFIPVYKSLKK